jgi:hypothetical protein
MTAMLAMLVDGLRRRPEYGDLTTASGRHHLWPS